LTREVTLLLLVGGWGKSAVERALDGAHRAAARDLLATFLDAEMIGRAIVAADDPAWHDALDGLPVVVDIDSSGDPFHFGRRLAGLIKKYDARRVLYSGGGSAPLLSAERWKETLSRLGEAERIVVTNNVHSCDWVGFAPAADVVPLIARQTSDNAIAWVLADEAGLPVESLPASAATRFDLDTPVDLLIARRHPATGPNLRRFLDGLDWNVPQLDGVLAEMAREGGSLVIAGRVSEAAWAALNRATRCWVRVFAEERGMRASGRQARGEVRSLLADYLEIVGVTGFFDELATLANGTLLDSRVILAAQGLWPSKDDRFNSDLLRWGTVKDPFLRRFTQAAAESRVPVVLGGHSVVAGGLMALVELLGTNHEEA
jgi:CTP:molybdopterin cytidylyltransferase MocA